MKKLILLAALAAGVAYVVKFKSGQVKSAATKVTHDPRVQSALATASEKAGPVASSVSASVSSAATAASSAVTDRLHPSDTLDAPEVPEEAVEVAETDPVSAPEFAGEDRAGTDTGTEPEQAAPADREATGRQPDPLTDPIETLDAQEGASGEAPEKPTE